MQKFFVKSSQIEDDEIQVCNEETSQNYICKINNYNKEEILCNIIEKIESKAETKVAIDVCQR